MNPVIHSENHHTIVYDADRIPEPELCLFDPGYWDRKGAVTGQATGRGSALFLDTSFGPAVLRPYLRGGWPARISRDRYSYSGIARSRPVREFNILKDMAALGLPVPVPLAALVDRGWFSYRGSMLMEQILGVKPLSDYLGIETENSVIWSGTGECIRQFHEAGVNHADLNTHNLLIDPNEGKVYLVDFDRCTMSKGSVVAGEPNLARLKRSLVKLWPADNKVSIVKCWKSLMDGYHG